MDTALRRAIKKALKDYDEVIDQDDATDDEREEAAHECVAEIREAYEDETEETPNLNNPIAKLQERAQASGGEMPLYVFKQSGESHMPTFECTCSAEGYRRNATGKNKQQAKRRAARAVLEAIFDYQEHG